MKIKTKLTTFFLLLALLFLPTSNAYAQDPGGDIVLLGQNYTLENGETLNGSLAVIGGNANIEEDATVNGDIALIGGNLKVNGNVNGIVALIGGNLTISGEIDGDIVVVGGQVLLTETAVVNGSVSTIGGQVTKEAGAQVSGQITNNAPPINAPDVPNIPNMPNASSIDITFNPLWEIASIIGRAFAIAAIGMLLTLFLQPQLERVADTIVRQPLMAGSFGLLTLVLGPIAIGIMIVTILLIPVAAIAVFILLPTAWLFGMTALGREVGERFTKAINQTWAPVLETGFGTFILLLVGGFVALIPCFGWLIFIIASLVAIGGVMMTWFGARSTPGAMTPQVQVPPAS